MDVALVYNNVRNARGRESLRAAVLLLEILRGLRIAVLTAVFVALIAAVVSTADEGL
jgi:hypothetical protein